MFDVITVGSATLDVFIKSDLSKLIRVSDVLSEKEYLCYDYGSKVNVDQIEFLTGGGATNTAISFARLGLEAAFLGKVGKEDDAGKKVLAQLAAEGVETRYAALSNSQPTGYSVILVSYEGDRTVLTFRGANNTLDETDVNWDFLNETKWLYMSSLSGRSAEMAHTVASRAAESGVKLAFNPGATQLKTRIKGLKAIFETTQVLVVNRQEAEMVTGVEARRSWVNYEKCTFCGKCIDACEHEILSKDHGRISVGRLEACRQCGKCVEACPNDATLVEPWAYNLFEIFRVLLSAGVKVAVITDGKWGSQASDGENLYLFPAFDAPVVDTLGAGDAFASAFVAEYIKSGDIGRALQTGTANSSSVVRYFGAKQGLLTRDEAEDLIVRKSDKSDPKSDAYFVRKTPMNQLVAK